MSALIFYSLEPLKEQGGCRNDPCIRFRGCIHENIWPAINRYRSIKGGRIGQSDLVFDHEGYEGDQTHKHYRNLPLLRKALREDPSRIFSWCHLANIYLALGKERLAEKIWKIALNRVRKKRWLQAEDSLPYLGLIRLESNRGERDLEPLLTEAITRFPRNLEFKWIRGRTLMSGRHFAEAVSVFKNLIACGEIGNFDRSMAYDIRIFTVLSYASLATCYFKLGNYTESRKYFELAAQCEPNNTEYQVKSALCSRLEGLP